MRLLLKFSFTLLVLIALLGNGWAKSEPVTQSTLEVRTAPGGQTNLAEKINEMRGELAQMPGASREDQPVEGVTTPTPIWQALTDLQMDLKTNSVMVVDLPQAVSSELVTQARQAESLWNTGQYVPAIALIKPIEEATNGQGMAVGLNWINAIQGPTWGTDIKINNRKNIDDTCLDYDYTTGYLFSVLKWNTNWCVNLSTDGGQNWQETAHWYTNYVINDITAAVLKGYFFVAYTGGANQDNATIRRFLVSDGSADDGYGSVTIYNHQIPIREIVIATNEDQYSDGIYCMSILSDNTLRYHYAHKNTDWKTWEDNGVVVNTASRGLDVCYNKYPGYFMFLSYIATNNELRMARKNPSGWEIYGFTNLETLSHSNKVTVISAWENNVIIGFEHTFATGPGIRCLLTDNGSDGTWWIYNVAKPVSNEEFYQPAVAARNGGGYGIAFIEEAGSFDKCWFAHKEYDINSPWDPPETFNEVDAKSQYPLSMEWVPPKPGFNYAYGVIWIEDPNGYAYFDRTDGVPQECTKWITVKTPNGGETWYVGEKYWITWETEKQVGQVRIDISTTNGASWWDVTQGQYTANDGSYQYEPVPQNISNQCLFRVVAVCNESVQDRSDNVFTITTSDPEIEVEPNPWDYGPVVVNTTAPKSFEIKNYGVQDLKVYSMSFVGTNPSEFSIQSGGNPPFTIAPGGKRHMVINFQPTSTGDKSASLSITCNDPDEAIYLLNLSGKGIGEPDISVDPSSYNYGSVNVNDSKDKTFVIKNTGTVNLQVSSVSIKGTHVSQFSILSGGGSFTLAPNATRDLKVRFKPTSESDKSAYIEIRSNDPNEDPKNVNIYGKGVKYEPDITADPGSYNFGSVKVGETKDKTFQIKNVGNANLSVYSTTMTGSDDDEFYIISGGGSYTLTPGSTRNLKIQFKPDSPGSKNAKVRLNNNDPDENPFYIDLSGLGVGEPDISVDPSSYNYGSVNVNSSKDQDFTVKNKGTAYLNVSSVSIKGTHASHFSIISGGGSFSLAPNATRTVKVRFKPTSESDKNAYIEFRSNDPDEDPRNVNIYGKGIRYEPDITSDPGSYDFGTVKVGESDEKTFQIKNVGNANLYVYSTTITGTDHDEFNIQSGGGSYTLTPGATRNLKIQFKPDSPGSKTAKVQITSNDPNENPFFIDLEGKGGQIEPDWKVPITVSGSNNVSFSLNFGGDKNGSDGFDPGLDVAAPPGFSYYAYFLISGTMNSLSTDIRKWVSPYKTDITWTLVIEKASVYPRITSTITWDPNKLPNVDGTFRLKGPGININMRTQNMVQVSGDAQLKIEFRGENISTHTYNFSRPGWYLISLPVKPADNRLSILFPSSPSAYAYDPNTKNYVPVTRLETEVGYWLLVPSATTVNVTGVVVETFTRSYTPGWHLIGTVDGNTSFTDPNDNPDNSVVGANGWDPVTQQYTQVYPGGSGVLKAGEGYWVAMIRACNLTIGTSSLAKPTSGEPVSLNKFYQQFGSQPPRPPFFEEGQVSAVIPEQSDISHNYPNPFNASTTINFSLKQAGMTQIYVYNTIGQRIRTLVDAHKTAGGHQVVWDGMNDDGELVTSGIYFYVIITSDFTETQKMIMMK